MEIKTYAQYEFNSNGQYRLKGSRSGLWLNGSYDGAKEYLLCTINKKTDYIHRVMWKIFKGSIPEGYEIDHLNSIKTDNRIGNLECVTMQENRKRAQKNNSAFREKAQTAHTLKRKIK